MPTLLSQLGLKNPVPLLLTEKNVSVEVQTSIQGTLAGLGKSPRLAFGRVELRLSEAGLNSVAEASLEAGSLAVVSTDISASDHARILKQVFERVLEPTRFPVIQLRFSELVGDFSGPKPRIQANGSLTLKGRTRPIAIHFKPMVEPMVEPMGGTLYAATVGLRQSEFGIAPLSAFLGALRCEDELQIAVRVRIPKKTDSL